MDWIKYTCNWIWSVVQNDDESIQGKGKGRKRAAARGRGRGATPSKRGRKSENSALQRMLMNKDDDDDDDDDDDVTKRLNKSQPRVGDFQILSLRGILFVHIN